MADDTLLSAVDAEAEAEPILSVTDDQTAATQEEQAVEASTESVVVPDANGEGLDGEADRLTGAPETYESFNLPEGYTLEGDGLETFHSKARDLNLDQTQAQALVDLHIDTMKQMQDTQASANRDQLANWLNELKTDTDFGGDKFDASRSEASRFLRQFGEPGLDEAFKSFGVDRIPALFRTFVRAGRGLTEDRIESGQPTVETYSGLQYQNSDHTN